MDAENLSFTDRVDRKLVGSAGVGAADGTVRCKERSFYPFVFAVHVFQYAFSQCDGSAAGCIQFMDMMSLAHGDVITGELIHYFCQILVDRREDSYSKTEVGRPEKGFSSFGT